MTICDLQLRLNLTHAKSAHQQPEMNSKGGMGLGVGVIQGHQGHMTWDGTGASVAGLQLTMKAAAGGTELWADTFLPPPSALPDSLDPTEGLHRTPIP